MRIVVTGATGFVGSHLTSRLVADGHDVVAMTRHPDTYGGPATAAFGDVGTPNSLRGVLEGADVAYYLVHSLEQADFAERDRAGATAFGQAAAAAGVRQVVYLGGLGNECDDLSPHLRSRREVEHILTDTAPTTALRAAVVVGEGSISWEILCQLIERLPVMITPRWVDRNCQPIALSDAIEYLVRVAGLDAAIGEKFDIGCPEALTYRDMLQTVGRLTGRHRLIIPVPVLSPRLSSHWLRLVTNVDLATARSLVDSLTNDVVVTERRIERLVRHRAMGFRAAAEAALVDRLRASPEPTPAPA